MQPVPNNPQVAVFDARMLRQTQRVGMPRRWTNWGILHLGDFEDDVLVHCPCQPKGWLVVHGPVVFLGIFYIKGGSTLGLGIVNPLNLKHQPACHWLIMVNQQVGTHLILFCPNMEEANQINQSWVGCSRISNPLRSSGFAAVIFIRKGWPTFCLFRFARNESLGEKQKSQSLWKMNLLL